MDLEKVNAGVAEFEAQRQAEQEQAEREANKGILDRINDSISGIINGDAIRNAMGETYHNGYDMNPTTPRPFGAVQDVVGDAVSSVQQWNENRLKFLHDSANFSEKAMNGQITEEDVDNLRQSGRDASVSLTNIAASPFRQAARNLMEEADDNTSPWQGIAQSLQMTDVAQEYFMTPAEKLQKSREIEQDLGIPAGSTLANNDAYREALEIYNFKQKSDNIEEVWEKYPELQRIADMDPEGAAVALHDMQTVKNTRGVVDTFMSFLEKGNTELEYNNLQYKIMMGRATDEEIKRAEDLKGRVEQYNKMEAPGFFQSPLASMAAGVAGSLPEMGQSLAEGVEGGGAAGAALTVGAVALTVISGGTDLLAAGGVAAMRAAIMRALASEAGRNLLKTGFYSGMIHGMAAPESGRTYGEMKGMKKPDGTPLYTDEEARNWSLLRGYTNAAIEVANFGLAAKAVYPVANRVFAQSVEQVMREKLGRETLKDFARGRVGDWLKLTASESAEEAAQSVADDVLYNAALSTKGEEGARYQQYSVMDIATRAGQAFIESLPASMGFATVGAGVGTITGAGRIARARKRAADMERDYGQKNTQTMMGVMAVEQLQKAVEQGNLEKVAPDVQKKVLKEQLAGTEFSRAYIDVEMAMQKENGREDLQKVAEAAGMSADELEAAITVNGYIPVGTETLAQAKVSPDLLDSVSFSEDADSMARMRANGKTIIEDYKKNFDKMVKRQEKLADAIIENNMKNATAEQKEILRQVMLSNISNPAQAWNDLRKMYSDELQEKIAPALEALKRGMGNAGLREIEDEQGNKKTVRYTENDEWYRNFYKTFKRKPTTAELEDMAIAMVTGDSNAPQVAGWIPDSAEAQAEFEKNRPVIEQLKNNIALLDSVKDEAKKLTGVEMELTQGLTPEAFKVYRAISSWTNKAGGKIARAGRISAILVARHADLYAEAVRKKTGRNYTAEDYIRERLGFQLVQAGIDRDGVLKQLAGEPHTLAAYHNTHVDNLEKLLEQGLAVPSIAITNKDIPYDNFGNVTLVGNRNLIDPESGVPVWTRDAYTTRIPRAEYLPTDKSKIKAFMDKWRKNLQGIGEGEYVLDRLEEAAQEDPERVEARTHRDEFTYYYLTKVLGRNVELKHIRPDYEVPILRNGIYAKQIESIMHSKRKKADKKKAVAEILITRYEKALEDYAESIPKKKAYMEAQPSPKRKMLYEKALEHQRDAQEKLATLKQTGEISEEEYKEIRQDVSRVDKVEKESTEIDWGKTFSEMRANNKDALNSDNYQQWQDKLLDDIRGDAVIKIGHKYEPYTTDNIVRAMLAEKGAGQEGGLGFSTSKAAAMGATPLKSIADLHKNESRLVTREQANSVIADVDTAIDESFEGVREYHKNIAADSYSLPEIYNEAVANAIKGGKKATAANMKTALKKMDFDVDKIPASAIDKAVDAANKMREAAAWYFEAKPQRAVGINEFSGAVVPIDTPAETIRKLEDNGLTVETYNPEVAGDRQRATKAVQAARAETLFQRAWHGTPHDFEKFDLGAIGTGEGAQAHGWGLYFAQDKGVSKAYKERLTPDVESIDYYEIGGKQYAHDKRGKWVRLERRGETWTEHDITPFERAVLFTFDKAGQDAQKAAESLKERLSGKNTPGDKAIQQGIDVLSGSIEKKNWKNSGGRLFEVEIPDNDVLLDEQKTLSQQPEKVQQAVEEIIADIKNSGILTIIAERIKRNYSDMTGREFYEELTDYYRQRELYKKISNNGTPDKVASETLNKKGVKGITYEGGIDGRCFVVFDNKAIDIIEKYNQRAWHGTAFNFKQFDLGAVGTGEGAQAHGYGLYSAADRAVAKRYQKVLSEKTKGSFAKFVRRLTGIDIGQKGSLYEVEVPDNNVLLNEEKTFDEQHKNVKTILGKALKEISLADLPDNAKKSLAKGEKAAKDRKVKDLYNDITVYTNRINQVEENLEGEEAEKNIKELEKKIEEAEKQIANIEQEQKAKEWYKDLTGKEIYKILSNIEGGDKQASQFLNAIGIKGITYNGFEDGRCFVVFDDKSMEIINRYNQQFNSEQEEVNGWIDEDKKHPGRHIISIMETADESTFMHEMAHAFLFDLEELARIDKTYEKELATVNQWAEWKKGDYKEYKRTAWADEFAKLEQEIIDAEEHHDIVTAKAKKAQWRQERFARGFEMYLREGNAPAPGLKAVFRKFKQFLNAIYKAFTGDGGKPSEPVRRVMDRMIATDEEIEIAALNDRYKDLEKAGGEKLFDESNKETMKRWLEEEKETAKEKVLKIVMRDLEKKRQKEYAAKLDRERERYQKELEQENIFLARNVLAETKDKDSVTLWFDSVEEFEALNATVPAIDVLVAQHMQQYTEELDKSMIDNQLSQEAIDKAMESGKYKAKMERYILKGMERKKDLINQINEKARSALNAVEKKLDNLPDDADLQMDKKINPTIKEIVKELTKLRFAAKWDTEDINHIEFMLRASTQADVRKAIKNFKERQRKKERNLQDIEEATKGMESFYRDLIKQTTADRPMSETCNIKYYKDKERNTERRVQQMAKAQNWEMAIHQQRQKVFYSMMIRQARENRDTRDKMIKDLQRKLNARTVKIPKDERYWFNRILYIMRLNPTNPKMPEGGVTSLDNIFKEQQEALENIYVPEQLIKIRDAGENFGDYNKMTLNDFREAYEDLARLYELGRTKFNFKSIAGKSFEDVAREIIEDPGKLPGLMALTRKVGPNQGGIGYIDALGNLGQTGHDVAKYIQQYHNSILKPENILEMLGPKAQKYIYGLLEKAAEKEAILAEKNLRAIQDINAMFTREEHQEWTEQKYDFPGTKGWKITKENILMMAINYGSEKNRQRLIGGLIEDGRKKDKMSAQQVQEAIEDLFRETMTAKDWEFVQRLWDHIGSYWHETAAVEEKLNGIALGKVEPLPFSIQTADGKVVNLKGGYMHIKYDFEKSARAEENEINDMAMSISAGARRLGVGRGMVKARTEHNVYMEVVLNFDVINQHLQDVIHNIAYRIPVRDIYRLLHYKNDSAGLTMETYIKESLGAEAFRVLDAWAMDSWRQVSDNRNSAESSINKFFRGVRSNATMAIMGFRIKPVLENIGNLPIAMNQIGSIKMLNALFGFYGNRVENYQEVIARSAFMRTRAENLDRDLKNQPGVFHQGNKLLETAKEHAYDMLVVTDLMVSAPMWWQVYHESIKPKMKEVQKENEENMQKRIDLANKADSIRAEIAGHFKGAADIDEHLKVRRYGTPADIEALRGTEFAGLSEGELRAQWGQHQNEIRNLRKELFQVEQEQEKANQLPVYTNAEIQEEAIQRAVFAADKVVRDTIGSGRVIDQSAVQRSTNELVRLFTAFYSFFNAQWNLIYMAYAKSKYAPEGTGSIEKWAPLAKTLMFNVFLSALLTTAVGFAFGLKGDSDDEKYETITNDGKKEKVEKPWLERFLRAYAKESLSVSTGGLYGIRDIIQLVGDYAFSGQNFGYKMGSVATRGFSEVLRAGDMLIRKGEKDAEIQAQQDKRQKAHEEKLAKLKGKKRREYLAKWEEEQKYRKPPKRITYEEILSHGVSGLTTLTAAKTGLTTTLTDAITHTMMYMMDKDMRYDPSWKNIVWSAIFDKKPVEREIPKKPPKEEKKKSKRRNKQSEQ